MARNLAMAALALWATEALADFDPDAYPAHETCAVCHGLHGVSHMAKFPHLGGQDPTYLEAQIRAFLEGERTNDGGQMAAVVTELDPADIPAVLDWFSTQAAPEPAQTGDTSGGAALYASAGCGTCHDNAGALAGVPHLRAQHAEYLAKQMRDFRTGRRSPGAPDVDHRPLIPPEDAAIEAIAAYLSAEPRQ